MKNNQKKPPSLFAWLLVLSFKFSNWVFDLKFSYKKENLKGNRFIPVKRNPDVFEDIFFDKQRCIMLNGSNEFNVNDILLINEYKKDLNTYTNRSCRRRITHISDLSLNIANASKCRIASLKRC